jgi:hypothetical protein
MQAPRDPGSAHDWQEPAQGESQQTPCAQNVDWHSTEREHDAPRAFLPHELSLQTLGPRQF